MNIENESATDVKSMENAYDEVKSLENVYIKCPRGQTFFFFYKRVAIFVFCLRNNKMESKKENLFMNVFNLTPSELFSIHHCIYSYFACFQFEKIFFYRRHVEPRKNRNKKCVFIPHRNDSTYSLVLHIGAHVKTTVFKG